MAPHGREQDFQIGDNSTERWGFLLAHKKTSNGPEKSIDKIPEMEYNPG
jgi:hypothetical protein